MRSTSKKVKISVVSSSGEVQSTKPSLSQIRLARIKHEKERAREGVQEGKCDNEIVSILLLISTSPDLTRHSRQLLADAYLEAGVDTHNLDSELDFQPDPELIFQHQHAEEDIDSDEDEDFTNESAELIYRYIF